MIIVILIIVGGGLWARNREKRDWNRGWCPDCLMLWHHFDCDSQGGRGYHCECTPRRYIWISYNVD